MSDDDAQVGMLPMVATPERREIMAGYFALTLKADAQLQPEKARAFAAVAISLGLHPLAGELMIIEGRLYVTIDGRRRLAMRHSDFAAIEPFIVTDQATRVAMGAGRRGDILAACRLYRKSTPIASIQYGLVREAERWPSKDRQGYNRSSKENYKIEGEQTKLGLTDEQVEAAKKAHDPDSLFDVARFPEAKVRPVLTQPAMMALKRAEARALSLMASVSLPTYDSETGAVIEEGPNGNGDDDANTVEGELVQHEQEAAGSSVKEHRSARSPEPVPSASPGAEPEVAGSNPAPPPEPTPAEDLRPEPDDEAPASTQADAQETGEPDTMARDVPAAPAPARRRTQERAGPVGGGLVRAPDKPEDIVRFAISHLHYRNIAAVLSAVNVSDPQQITDCAAAWETLTKLAPAGTSA